MFLCNVSIHLPDYVSQKTIFFSIKLISYNNMVFWVVMSHSSDRYRYFGRTYRLHLQDIKVRQTRKPAEVGGKLVACWI
jgi:hypothetical protein